MENTKGNNSKWKTTDNRFVAFLDILGFKDLVARNSHEYIYELLQSITHTKKVIKDASAHPTIMKELGDVDVHIVNFSDSIALFSKNDDPKNFKYFLLSVRWIFTEAIKKGIPLKGGFAHGTVSLNKTDQIYYGQAIIDAYLIEEEVNYYGVVAHNSIDKYMFDNKIPEIDKILFESETPLKCGNIVHTNINWFKIMKYETIEDLKNKIESYRNTSSGSPRRYVDNTLHVLEKVKDSIVLNTEE